MRIFLTVIILALLGYSIGFVLFVGNLPIAPTAVPRADGIVALTGGDDRLNTAVSMLEHGVAQRLLVSGATARAGEPRSFSKKRPPVCPASAAWCR